MSATIKQSMPPLAAAKKLSGKPKAKSGAAAKKNRRKAQAANDGHIPFKIRFQAWWDGVEPEALVSRGQKSKVKRARHVIELNTKPDLPADTSWAGARVQICDLVWGEGYVAPGGAKYGLENVLPFPPGRDTKVLDLSAGLSGRMTRLAGDGHVIITGMERDGEFVDHALTRAALADREGVLPISGLNPDRLNLRGIKYHYIIARELFFTIADKMTLLKTLRNGLRQKGTIAFTDFVLAEFDPNEGAVMEQWHRIEPHAPHPWSIDEYRIRLQELDLEIVHLDDDSEHYRGLVVAAWRQFVDQLDSRNIDRAFVDALMPEAELWLQRVRALKCGQLRLVRITARNSANLLMSGPKRT